LCRITGASASGSDLRYYLGTADGSNRTYRYIEQGSVGLLDTNDTSNDKINPFGWDIPDNIADGSYRIWVLADSSSEVAENNESNNWGSSASFTIHVPRPDFIVTDILMAGSTALPTVWPGQNVRLDFDTKNQGDDTTQAGVHMKWWWGTSQGAMTHEIDTGNLGTVNGLSPGETERESDVSWTIPTDAAGTYWLTAKIDWDGQVAESNESNNVRSELFNIVTQLPIIGAQHYVGPVGDVGAGAAEQGVVYMGEHGWATGSGSGIGEDSAVTLYDSNWNQTYQHVYEGTNYFYVNDEPYRVVHVGDVAYGEGYVYAPLQLDEVGESDGNVEMEYIARYSVDGALDGGWGIRMAPSVAHISGVAYHDGILYGAEYVKSSGPGTWDTARIFAFEITDGVGLISSTTNDSGLIHDTYHVNIPYLNGVAVEVQNNLPSAYFTFGGSPIDGNAPIKMPTPVIGLPSSRTAAIAVIPLAELMAATSPAEAVSLSYDDYCTYDAVPHAEGLTFDGCGNLWVSRGRNVAMLGTGDLYNRWPEIEVTQGTTVVVEDGSPFDFGRVLEGEDRELEFTISNRVSGSVLTVGSVVLDNNDGFEITQQPGSSVVCGSSTTFRIKLIADTPGGKLADVRFSNGDSNESPFNFRIVGDVGDGIAPSITSWTSAVDHGTAGELALAILDDGTFCEPRAGGIATLVLEFSEGVDLSGATVVVADGQGSPVDIGDTTATISNRAPGVGQILFSAALPDAARYSIRVEGVVDLGGHALAGDNDRTMVALVGDINGDGRVSSRDRRDLRDAYGSAGGDATYAIVADLNGDGRISSRDRRVLRDNYGAALAVPATMPLPRTSLGDMDSNASSPAPSVLPSDADDVLAMAAAWTALPAETVPVALTPSTDSNTPQDIPLVSIQAPSTDVPTTYTVLPSQFQLTSTSRPVPADAPAASQLEPDIGPDVIDILGEEPDAPFAVD